MPDLHIVDETWIGVPPEALADAVARPASWRRWWPRLRLDPTELRGDKGVRWAVTRAPHGGTGTAELWLSAELDGTVAYWILRLDYPAGSGLDERALATLELDYRAETKRALWALADELDTARRQRLTSVAPPAATARPASRPRSQTTPGPASR